MRSERTEFDRRQDEALYLGLTFFHDKLNREMDCRGFASLEEMHAHMIAAWNQTVSPKDEVFILGDFSVGKAEETNENCAAVEG